MRPPVVRVVLPGMVMAWDTAHILLALSAASAVAAAAAVAAVDIVVTAAVALA